jgi:hypothetical protein
VLLQPLQLSIELDKFSPQASQFPLGQAQAPSPLIQEVAAANNCGMVGAEPAVFGSKLSAVRPLVRAGLTA